MTKRISSFLLALALIIAGIPALAESSSITMNDLNQIAGDDPGSGQSPSLSVTLNNLNQVTEIVANPGQSPTMSMTLNNLNQVTGISPGLSPTMSMTLNNLNQVTGTNVGYVPSPTLSMSLNMLNRFTAIAEYGVSLAGLFTIRGTLSADARAAFNSIAAYVDKGQAVIGYFGMDVSDLVGTGGLSSNYRGFDFSSLILSEYVSLDINNYQGNSVDVISTFEFASEYRDGQTVVAMFGYRDRNGDIVWQPLNTVAADGQVIVDIPSALLLLAGSQAILGILS